MHLSYSLDQRKERPKSEPILSISLHQKMSIGLATDTEAEPFVQCSSAILLEHLESRW